MPSSHENPLESILEKRTDDRSEDIDHEERTQVPGRIWAKGELPILESHLSAYTLTPSKERTNYIRVQVLEDIRKFWGDRYSKPKLKQTERNMEWKKKKRVANWFSNQSHRMKEMKIAGLSTSVAKSKIVEFLFKSDIEERASALSGSIKGTTEWFRVYRTALSEVMKGLDDEDMEKVTEEQTKWEKAGLPTEIQGETATKRGRKYCRLMDEWRFKMMGMRCFTLEYHHRADGSIVWASHDFNDEFRQKNVGIPSFEQFAPEAVSEVGNKWASYVSHIEGLERGHSQAVPQKNRFHTDDIKVTSSGVPIVPPPFLSNGIETAENQRNIIRKYLNMHYSVAFGDGKIHSVPWKQVDADIKRFIEPEYWPRNVPVKDPSRYKREESEAIVGQWRRRQRRGEKDFRFSNVIDKAEFRVARYPKEGMPQESPLLKAKHQKQKSYRGKVFSDGDLTSSEEGGSESTGGQKKITTRPSRRMRAEVPPAKYPKNKRQTTYRGTENESLTTEQWPSPTLMHQPESRDATSPPPSEDEKDLPSESSDPNDQQDLHQRMLTSAENPTDTEKTTGRSRRLRKPPKCPTALIDEAILRSEEHKERQRTKGQQQKTIKGREK